MNKTKTNKTKTNKTKTNKTKTNKTKTNKTKTRKNKKSYTGSIVVEKYFNNVLGVNTYLYIVHLNQRVSCRKQLGPKNNSKTLKLRKYIDFSSLLKNYMINKIKIEKNDKDIMNKMTSLFDVNTKYTYCLNHDTLVISETKTKKNKSNIKDFFSKHGLLCDQTVCAAGEMKFKQKPNGSYKMVFDNGSGTFRPSKSDLEVLKKELPYFDTETINFTP
jgi:hypothetical protein